MQFNYFHFSGNHFPESDAKSIPTDYFLTFQYMYLGKNNISSFMELENRHPLIISMVFDLYFTYIQ